MKSVIFFKTGQYKFCFFDTTLGNSDSIKPLIAELFREAARFNSNDPLVQVRRDKGILIESNEANFVLKPSTILRKLISEDQQFVREKGSSTLCMAVGTVHLTQNKKEIEAPLFLVPLSYSFSKINDQYTFKLIEEERFFNPFLEKEFPELIHSAEDIEVYFSAIREILPNLQFTDNKIIDNFHYHRKAIIRDLNDLQQVDLNPAVREILEGETASEKSIIKFGDTHFFPLSPDQKVVLDTLQTRNVVLQGPPGTGKSQLIGEMAVQSCASRLKTWIVSEKKVALDVIYAKLKTAGLEDFCFAFEAHKNNAAFSKKLRTIWDKLDNFDAPKSIHISSSKALTDQLDFRLSMYRSENLIGGLSYERFFEQFREIAGEGEKYDPAAPELHMVMEHKEDLAALYQSGLQKILPSLAGGAFEKKHLTRIHAELHAAEQDIEEIRKVISELNKKSVLDSDTFDTKNFDLLRKFAVEAALRTSESSRKFAALKKPKEQRKFERLFREFNSLKQEESGIQELEAQWKNVPGPQDLEAFEALSELSFLKRKRLIRFLRNSLKDKNKAIEAAIRDLQAIHAFRKSKHLLNTKLADSGIHFPDSEMYEAMSLVSSFKIHGNESFPQEFEDQLSRLNLKLNSINELLKSYFTLDPGDRIDEIFTLFHENIQLIFENLHIIDRLPKLQIRSLLNYATFEELRSKAALRAWIDFKNQYPEFAEKKVSDLAKLIEQIDTELKSDAGSLVREIKHDRHTQFVYYNEILRKESKYLSTQDKILKKELKKGKQILVKEFAKKQRHISSRDLLESEAGIWIHLLLPVILGNPEQISSNFPLKGNNCDLLIFDEATQIPFYRSLPCIARAKRVLVAGDSQQMGTQSYFEAGEDSITDLLHQAQFHYEKRALYDHLRSEHPALIAFSNKHFYANTLKAYPAFAALKRPLIFEFVEEGRFSDRKNIPEARKVAAQFTTLLKGKESVGLVAFSEIQLSEILSHLSSEAIEKLEERSEKGLAFAKTLEKVQGDECDILLISFGYGADEYGKFNLRFGPLSRQSGTKRLNVLFTRARKQIILYASVKHSDFALSDNEAVNLLRSYFRQIEDYQQAESELDFPMAKNSYIREKNVIRLKNPARHFASAGELLHVWRVLKAKGWEVGFGE